MHTPRSRVQLRRPHTQKASPLRAWSAADQLVLDHLGDTDVGRTLVVNDEFGALTCGLAHAGPTVWTDSVMSRTAIAANMKANDLEAIERARWIHGDELPQGEFDTVVVRVPKTSALLEHQLRAVRAVSAPSAQIVGTGMVRHIHTSTVEAFEQHVGTTTTSRASRKARLIHAAPTARTTGPPALVPTEFTTGSGLRIAQYPGTFSAGHLDVGSALLLDVLAEQDQPPGGAVVADLGCGNGVLAAEMARRWQHAHFLKRW